MKYVVLLSVLFLGAFGALASDEPKRIKLVILDNSGTTNDCGVYAPVIAFCKLFQKHGLEISFDEARAPMGLFKKDHIRAILKMERVKALFQATYQREWTEEDVEKMFIDFIPIQLSCLEEYADLIPGTKETMALLRDKYGVKIGLTTGFNQEMNEIMLKKAKEQGYTPDTYTSSSQVLKGRPYWYMVEENMKQAEILDPEEVLKVGDTVADMQEGKAIRKISSKATWTLGLSATGNYVGKRWQEMIDTPGDEMQRGEQVAEAILYRGGADYVAPNINSLPAIIELINARLADGESPREIPLDYLN